MFGFGSRMSKKQRREAAAVPLPGALGVVATTVVSGIEGITIQDHTKQDYNSMDTEKEVSLRAWPTQVDGGVEPTPVPADATQPEPNNEDEDESPPEPLPMGVENEDVVSTTGYNWARKGSLLKESLYRTTKRRTSSRRNGTPTFSWSCSSRWRALPQGNASNAVAAIQTSYTAVGTVLERICSAKGVLPAVTSSRHFTDLRCGTARSSQDKI